MIYENLGTNKLGHLTFAGQDTVSLANEFGTPLYVMDELRIRERCREYKAAMGNAFPNGSLPLYASKALSTKRIYEIMKDEDMGIDVVSIGEIYTALKAGYPMGKAYFHGNNKTDEDLTFAMDNGIGYFVCDNFDELEALNKLAGEKGIIQKVLLRLTPGIDTHTHDKISTGRVDSKFGAPIETGQAEQLVLVALKQANIELVGYHCHIGSQIFEHTPFVDAARIMIEFVGKMAKEHNYLAEFLNLGGGMGVPYVEANEKINYTKNIAVIGELIGKACQTYGIEVPKILMEPGRSIVADSGITLYTVGASKNIPGFKNYTSIDGGMTDNLRYALYQADYTVELANRINEEKTFLTDVVGRCCESGDIIQEKVMLPKPTRGDIIAVLSTGAYNYSMASNYNRIPRPAMIMINQDGPYLAIKRETLDDLVSNDC